MEEGARSRVGSALISLAVSDRKMVSLFQSELVREIEGGKESRREEVKDGVRERDIQSLIYIILVQRQDCINSGIKKKV